MKKGKRILVVGLISSSIILLNGYNLLAAPPPPVPAPTLNPTTIPKFVNQLIIPPVYEPTIITDPNTGKVSHNYTIDVTEFNEQILPAPLPATKVWGYGGMIKNSSGQTVYFRNAPGATFEATKGIPVNVTWENKLTGPHMFAVDPTLHWANPNQMSMMPPLPWPAFPPGFPDAQSPVPIVTHLHGGEVQSDSDGHPDAWFTFSISSFSNEFFL